MLHPKSLPYGPDYQIYSVERDWYFRIVIAMILLMPVVACNIAEEKRETVCCATGAVVQCEPLPAPTIAQHSASNRQPCVSR